ncbi:hypothetical protein D3C87_2013470 [compost metagenome]
MQCLDLAAERPFLLQNRDDRLYAGLLIELADIEGGAKSAESASYNHDLAALSPAHERSAFH